ncbi:MAG: hypothetical protein IPP74_14430 [Alphaproteobacteria bacterium]|nr:hypothetical protein [Alphaproteobacteria bacterium]
MSKKIDIGILRKALVKMTIKQAALYFKIPYSTLYKVCAENNLKSGVLVKRGPPSLSDGHIEDIIKSYLEGMSQEKIAAKTGLCQKTVSNVIRKSAHHLRTRSDAAKLREKEKGIDLQKQQAAAANAVRHAMNVIKLFSW